MFVDYKLIHVLCNPFIKPKDIAKLTMHGFKIIVQIKYSEICIFKIGLKSTGNSIHFFNKYMICLSGIITITCKLSNIFRTWQVFPLNTSMYPTFWYSSCIFSFCIIFWTLSSRWEKNLGSISAPFVWGGTGLGISSNSNNVREQN